MKGAHSIMGSIRDTRAFVFYLVFPQTIRLHPVWRWAKWPAKRLLRLVQFLRVWTAKIRGLKDNYRICLFFFAISILHKFDQANEREKTATCTWSIWKVGIGNLTGSPIIRSPLVKPGTEGDGYEVMYVNNFSSCTKYIGLVNLFSQFRLSTHCNVRHHTSIISQGFYCTNL